MQPTRLEAYQLLHNGILAFARAEQQGMRIDVEYCIKKKAHLDRLVSKMETEFKESDFYKHWYHVYGKRTNIGSDPQLAHLLYDVRKLVPSQITSKSKRGSTNETVLRQLNISALNLRIEIEGLKKLRDTYLDAFVREQVNGYLHPFFNLHTVRTYRGSSDSPNFQNIPKRDQKAMQICRRAIFPRPGHQLGEVDYSGLEVRIATCYHKDPNMITYILDPSTDMHTDMGAQIFRIDHFDKFIPEHKYLRDAIKNGWTFPEFYGSYYANCAETIACQWCKLPRGPWSHGQGVPMPGGITISDHLISKGLSSYQAFEDHLRAVEQDFWGRRFRVYKRWKEQWWAQYQQTGHFDTFTGFRCSGVMKKNDVINYPVQGDAFHVLLKSFIEIDRISREEHWDTRLIGQIHDSILFDANPNELKHVIKTIKRITCEYVPSIWHWIIVPLEIDIEICEVDNSWADKRNYKL